MSKPPILQGKHIISLRLSFVVSDNVLMRLILFFFLFTTGAFAQDCSKIDVSLHGNIVFNTKVIFNEFPKVWTVNSDRFSSLFLKVKEGLEIDTVKFDLEYKNSRKTFTREVNTKKNKKGFMHIKDLSFQKNILPSYRMLPVKMKMEVLSKKKIICEQSYRLEVIL